MKEAPRDHVPVTPSHRPEPTRFSAFGLVLAGAWLALAIAAAVFAFGV
jgi:hypothetical protein